MSSFVDARLNAHFASQIVASVGSSCVQPVEDASHTALVWGASSRALEGASLPGTEVRAALRVRSLEVIVLDGGAVRSTIPLADRTLAEGVAALAAALGGPSLSPPAHELPKHPLADGARFVVDSESLARLERHFEAAAKALEGVRSREPGASPVRLWPHHFDIATLVTLDAGLDAESARSIGVGLSLGDGSYDEPYWYVSPWPYPKVDPSAVPLPMLPIGHWHTEGFFAAILTASAIASDGRDVDEGLRAAMTACRTLLDG